MPQISLIIPLYNAEKYLLPCLNSVAEQTFKDFEIILCDDGSTDDTYIVAKHNADIHKNIKLIRNEKNYGLNITLNNCLKIADGEYFARMDGDANDFFAVIHIFHLIGSDDTVFEFYAFA